LPFDDKVVTKLGGDVEKISSSLLEALLDVGVASLKP
jgi:hypothetical protein